MHTTTYVARLAYIWCALLAAAPAMAGLPLRQAALAPADKAVAVLVQDLAFRLSHLPVDGSSDAVAANWRALVDQTIALAAQRGFAAPEGVAASRTHDPQGEMFQIVAPGLGWVRGPDADAVLGRWLALISRADASPTGPRSLTFTERRLSVTLSDLLAGLPSS